MPYDREQSVHLSVIVSPGERAQMRESAKAEYNGSVSFMLRDLYKQYRKKKQKKSEQGT
jgi:hypothetical protein